MKSSAKTPIKVPIRSAKSREQLSDRAKDPVQVFCRVRPLHSETEESCVRIKSSTSVVLTPPEIAVNYKLNAQKETEYIFKHVFDATSTQREVYASVAEPLIENLIRGKNGLLFTYGVTGSGKTYTMTGNIHHHGIMPRCMDSLFKTISDYQTKKFIFKPDKLNGFEILSDADAMLERQAEMNSRFAKPRRKDSDPEIASQASTEAKVLLGLDEDNMYAVFVTYVEVYNNSVYDLLEDGGMQRTLQSKIIREDANHNMFVHGVTEIEIKSVEDALEIFQTGQKRKRMGDTILNAESSRSHSVFSIRLVQAPTDSQGEALIQDKQTILISQLSLVDLAGSERTNRTKNTGQRLREAGNINNSLMTLRTCLEYLRENQLSGAHKKVPYRDSKVTHLFKNYFEGEGQVCMIVCINPRAEDYDETSQVMKFAEMTQEVQVARPTPLKLDIGFTPGRRKANKLFKTDVEHLNNFGYAPVKNFEMDLGIVYSLGPSFPVLKYDSPETNEMNLELIKYLEQRIQKRHHLAENLEAKWNNFRMHLYQVERQNVELKTELSLIKAAYKKERESKISVENKLVIYESSIDELNRKLHERDDMLKSLQKDLAQKQYNLNQKELEKQKQKKKYTSKLAVEKDKIKSEFDIKMSEQRSRLEERMRVQDKKIRLVNDIMQADNVESLPSLARSHSTEDIQKISQQQNLPSIQAYSQTQTRHTPRTIRGVPVANVRHRRSKSAGDKWLEHRAANPVPLGTILQPYLKNRKSVTKLTDAKDLTNQKTSKYCLISQGADTDGEVETKLFKGNVIPTIGGGAQVVFDDVECLKQMSPVKSPQRKRPSNPTVLTEIPLEEITSRCNISMEGHSSKRPKM